MNLAPRAEVERLTGADLAERIGARRVGDGRWVARCPSHGDRGPSLSVREGEGGCVLLHCFAGCTFDSILDALGIEPRALFPHRDTRRPARPRPDPDREARDLARRLRVLHRPPTPDRMRRELRFLGGVLIGGTAALALAEARALEAGRPIRFETFALRVIFEAMQAVAAEGTPRRWWSPLALAREVGRWSRDAGWIYGWCRLAVGVWRRREAGRCV